MKKKYRVVLTASADGVNVHATFQIEAESVKQAEEKALQNMKKDVWKVLESSLM